MKKIISTILLLGLITASLNAQALWKRKRYEFGASLGTSQFFGDIGGFSKGDNALGLKDFSLKHTRYNLGISGKYRIIERVSARVSLTGGAFHATDLRGDNPDRAFESRTTFFEPSLLGEYYFIRNRNDRTWNFSRGRNSLQSMLDLLDVYAFTGIGSISYSVKPNEKLSLHTNFTDKGSSIVIPLGIGVNFMFTPDLTFGVELGARFTFSDTVEGYTSQYSKSNDMYYLLGFSAIYRMNTTSRGFPTFGRRY